MKYFFIIQGEGRGHLTQAMTLERLLVGHGHEVVCMMVGKSKSRTLPAFFEKAVHAPVRYFETFNFVASHNNKRPNPFSTFFYNAGIWYRFLPSIRYIRRTIREYAPDVVINFYEMLGSIACQRVGVPMICIGHQFFFLHKDCHIPEIGYEGHLGLDLFSKSIATGASKVLALSFRPMQPVKARKGSFDSRIKVMPPLLRPEVLEYRNADGSPRDGLEEGKYILGYMLNPGFADEILKWHKAHPDVPLHFFWDRADEAPVKVVDETLSFYYLDDKEFLYQMAGCRAYASTAGFESICEAMYLGKPLLMVPTHIEQKCNAYDATVGVRFNPSMPQDIRPAVTADTFDLDRLLSFAENEYVPDQSFVVWVRSAEALFLRELT